MSSGESDEVGMSRRFRPDDSPIQHFNRQVIVCRLLADFNSRDLEEEVFRTKGEKVN
jgi:hypothetical protein